MTDKPMTMREDAATAAEYRADAGVKSGSWDDGIDAWDAAQIIAAAIRALPGKEG